MKKQYKYLLNESDIPKQWYNIVPDLPNPLPPQLNPQTMEPIGPEDLAPLFPMGLILQEVSDQNYIDIPEPVLELYKIYRPSPMYRALRLEEALGTKSRIYYKYEGGSPSGSHKPNTAIPQAFYNAEEGVKKMVTETGAEVLAGSTRLGAGTAQKALLNAFSTSLMSQLGRVLGNEMLCVQATNEKLKSRQARILASQIDGFDQSRAYQLLRELNWDLRTGLLVASGWDRRDAQEALTDERPFRELLLRSR